MSSEWVRASLDRLAEINPVRKVRKGDLVPFVDMAALPQFSRDIGQGGVVYREAKGAGAHFRNGDTLLARITPCLENGKTAQVRLLEGDAIGEGSTEFIVLCGKDPADNDFVYYVCRDPTFREYAISRMEGTSGRQRVSWQAVAGYELDVAPKQERRGVAVILTSLDDRITLLRETNQTLEAIAQAIFKSWFVDFDPVRAKMEGRQPVGMDEETAALFPDELVESELGLIPKGWSVQTMSDVSTVGIGKTPPRKEQQWFSQNPQDVPWLSIRDMGLTGTFAARTSEYLVTDAVSKFNVRVVPAHTVVMSFKLTVGRLAITGVPMTTNEAIAHFTLSEDAIVSTEYLYLHLSLFNFSSLSSTSSIADAVNSKTVREIPLVVPALGVSRNFDDVLKPLFDRIYANESSIAHLSDLRDTLLPRLISGKLRVPVDETDAVVNEE